MTQEIDADRAQHDEKVVRLVEAFIVLGMTKRQAAVYAGFTYDQAKRILNSEQGQQLILDTREAMAKRYEVTKDRVVRGMVDAIERAQQLGEPNTELSGWKELAKMHGYYEPTTHNIKISTDQEELRRQIQEMTREQLLQIASAQSLPVEFVDAEYAEVSNGDA